MLHCPELVSSITPQAHSMCQKLVLQMPYPKAMNKHNNMGFSMLHSCCLSSSVSLPGACLTDSCQLSRGSLPCHRLQHPLALRSQPTTTEGEKLTICASVMMGAPSCYQRQPCTKLVASTTGPWLCVCSLQRTTECKM